MIKLHLSRQYSLFIGLILGFVSISGLLVGWTGKTAILFFLGAGVLVILSILSPFVVFALWFIITPFTQGQVIHLASGIPDLSIDRIFFLILIGRIFLEKLADSRKEKLSLSLENVLLLIFVGWGFFSILFWKRGNISGQFGALFNQFLLPLGFYLIVQYTVKNEKQIKSLIFLATVVLLLLALPTPIEEITGITLLGQNSELVSGVFRVQSFTRSAWEFGTIATILLAFSWHGLIFSYSPWRKALGFIAVFLGSLGILLTFMRGTWLAAAIITFIFLLSVRQLRRYVFFVAIFVLLIAWVFGPQIVQSDVWNTRVLDTKNILGRQDILTHQINLWLGSPIFGQGLLPTFEVYNLTIVAMSHNTIFSILVDFGLMCTPYFFAIGLIVIKGVRNYKQFCSIAIINKELWLVLVCAVLAYSIEAVTFETRVFPLLAIYLWISLGLIQVATNLAENERIIHA